MEWKVRALDDDGNPIEPKQKEQPEVQEEPKEVDTQEVKEEITDNKKEDGVSQQEEVVNEQVEKQAQDVQEEKQEVEQKVEKPYELDDNSILSYLKDRHNLEVESIEVLKNTEKKQEQSLPEEIAEFMKYQKETGRSFEDYAKLQQDWSKVDETTRLREYYKQTKPHLDIDEIDYLITEEYSYDADIDDEKDIKKKKIAYKEELYKATSHFEGLKEKYKAPLESRDANLPDEYKEAVSFYNEYREQSEKGQKAQEERSRIFAEKTNDLFSNDFKGFEFTAGEKKQVYKPNDVVKVKEVQSDINNFFNQHLDENGSVKDINKYHKALYAAQNADAIFKFAYEQGKADATDGIVKETKNIDMDIRQNTQTESSGIKFRALENDDTFSFKIKKR
jgi:hypothetical protein